MHDRHFGCSQQPRHRGPIEVVFEGQRLQHIQSLQRFIAGVGLHRRPVIEAGFVPGKLADQSRTVLDHTRQGAQSQRLAVAAALRGDHFLGQRPMRAVAENHHRLWQCLAGKSLERHTHLKV